MNKHQFISSLQQALAALDPSAVTDILADFEEHFAAGVARGKTEAAIATELGDPVEIGRQYVEASAEGRVYVQPVPGRMPPVQPAALPTHESAAEQGKQATPPPSGRKIDESGLIGVILLNLFIGIPLWLTLFSILIGFWAGAGSIGAAAVVLFVLAVFQAGVISLILILFGLALASLTVLSIVFLVYLTRWLILGLGAWIRWNKRLVFGGASA